MSNQIKKLTVKQMNAVSVESVLERLLFKSKRVVYTTVERYKNGYLANEFNESEMQALAEDTILEVIRRVRIYKKSPKNREAVEPRGADAYFERAFINQCQKRYEKFAMTDIRAGIQTIGSEEAMAAAAAKNLENPEDRLVLRDEIFNILKTLKAKDSEFNKALMAQNKSPRLNQIQHWEKIIEGLFLGFDNYEVNNSIKIDNATYIKQKQEAFNFIKNSINVSFSDLSAHFDASVDQRIHVKEVVKRKKAEKRLQDFTLEPNFAVSIKPGADSVELSLYLRLDAMDNGRRIKDLKAQLFCVKKIKCLPQDLAVAKKDLWESRDDDEVLHLVDKLSRRIMKVKKLPKAA